MTTTPLFLQSRLVGWTERQAVLMTLGVAWALAGSPLWPVSAVAGLSFAAMIVMCRGVWTGDGRFGAANWITAARLAGILLLPALKGQGAWAVLFGAVALLALDGIDGWLARRLGIASEFGEYFDKEADAFFLLLLCLLLYQDGRLGPWIVVPGLLRYAFVWLMKWAQPAAVKERQTAKGKWIYCAMMGALIFAFTPFPDLYVPATVLASALLVYSFAEATLDLYRSPG